MEQKLPRSCRPSQVLYLFGSRDLQWERHSALFLGGHRAVFCVKISGALPECKSPQHFPGRFDSSLGRQTDSWSQSQMHRDQEVQGMESCAEKLFSSTYRLGYAARQLMGVSGVWHGREPDRALRWKRPLEVLYSTSQLQ